ncbi:golgin candidate 5 [Striga asiatica]|uniref:Golgin candidate 5 n=1 Tax=Striga asiatica TaxID=4170 RepID=A0A5A7R0H9_STRAF|nr:golgin candidate 5 [Striga asiatica]
MFKSRAMWQKEVQVCAICAFNHTPEGVYLGQNSTFILGVRKKQSKVPHRDTARQEAWHGGSSCSGAAIPHGVVEGSGTAWSEALPRRGIFCTAWWRVLLTTRVLDLLVIMKSEFNQSTRQSASRNCDDAAV